MARNEALNARLRVVTCIHLPHAFIAPVLTAFHLRILAILDEMRGEQLPLTSMLASLGCMWTFDNKLFHKLGDNRFSLNSIRKHYNVPTFRTILLAGSKSSRSSGERSTGHCGEWPIAWMMQI
jgi:hypothetical protein